MKPNIHQRSPHGISRYTNHKNMHGSSVDRWKSEVTATPWNVICRTYLARITVWPTDSMLCRSLRYVGALNGLDQAFFLFGNEKFRSVRSEWHPHASALHSSDRIFLSIALQSVKMADPVLDLCEPTCYMYLYTVYRVAKGLEAFEAGSSFRSVAPHHWSNPFHVLWIQIHERLLHDLLSNAWKIDEFYRVQQHLQRPQRIPFRGTERSPCPPALWQRYGCVNASEQPGLYTASEGKSTMSQTAHLVSLVASATLPHCMWMYVISTMFDFNPCSRFYIFSISVYMLPKHESDTIYI